MSEKQLPQPDREDDDRTGLIDQKMLNAMRAKRAAEQEKSAAEQEEHDAEMILELLERSDESLNEEILMVEKRRNIYKSMDVDTTAEDDRLRHLYGALKARAMFPAAKNGKSVAEQAQDEAKRRVAEAEQVLDDLRKTQQALLSGLGHVELAPETTVRPIVQADSDSEFFTSADAVEQSTNFKSQEPAPTPQKPDEVDTSNREADPRTMIFNVPTQHGADDMFDLTGGSDDEIQAAHDYRAESRKDERRAESHKDEQPVIQQDPRLVEAYRQVRIRVDADMHKLDAIMSGKGLPLSTGDKRIANENRFAKVATDEIVGPIQAMIAAEKQQMSEQPGQTTAVSKSRQPQPVASTERGPVTTGEQAVQTPAKHKLADGEVPARPPIADPRGIAAVAETAVDVGTDEQQPEVKPPNPSLMDKLEQQKSVREKLSGHVGAIKERYSAMSRGQKLGVFAVAVALVGGSVGIYTVNAGDSETTIASSPEIDAVNVKGIEFPGGCITPETFDATLIAGEVSGGVEVSIKKPYPSKAYYKVPEKLIKPEKVVMKHTKVYADACVVDKENRTAGDVMDVNGTKVTIDRKGITPQILAETSVDSKSISLEPINSENVNDISGMSPADRAQWVGITAEGDPYNFITNDAIVAILKNAVKNKTYHSALTASLDAELKVGVEAQFEEYAKEAAVDKDQMELQFTGEYPEAEVMNGVYPDRKVKDEKTGVEKIQSPTDTYAKIMGKTAKVKTAPLKSDKSDKRPYVKFTANTDEKK